MSSDEMTIDTINLSDEQDITAEDDIDLEYRPNEDGRPVVVLLLEEKIYQVCAGLGRIEKLGRNASQGYNFVGIEQIMTHVRREFLKWRLILTSEVVKAEFTEIRREGKSSMFLAEVGVDFYITCVDSNNSLKRTFVGHAMDNGDKGLTKAYSSALKYFLFMNLLINRGEDLEADSPGEDPTGPLTRPVLPKEPPKSYTYLIETECKYTGRPLMDLGYDLVKALLEKYKDNFSINDKLAMSEFVNHVESSGLTRKPLK